MKKPPNDWCIINLINPSRGIGKSKLVEVYEDAYPDDTLVLDNSPARENYHLATAKGDKLRVIFFHLTRAEGGSPDYKSVESLKDGRYNSTKFRGRRVRASVDSPHPLVIIPINCKPAHFLGLSVKRWRLRYIKDSASPIEWFKLSDDLQEVHLPELYI